MATLTTNETTALTFMAEEEKLAFDVYTALASKWDLKIFTNIANNSETKHISSVETLADQYAIATPDLAVGVYESPELQALYDNLVAIGSRSITDALKVGIVVEVVDIEDLTNYLADTTNADLTTTFTKLLTDSEKHLSEFTKNLANYDQTLAEEEVSEWLTNAVEELYTVNLVKATSSNDTITGTGNLADTVSYETGATKGVTVNLALTSAQNTIGSGKDTITGIENLIGSKFNDKLKGDKNDNQLSGKAGNDVITGGLGADQLTGGSGSDKFVLTQAKDSGITLAAMDTITDFVRGKDTIDLSALDANTATKINNAFTGFIDATSTFTTAGQVKFDNGILYGNTDKDASAEFAIALTGITTLSVTDLIL
jgi:hypothetical protein